MTATGNQGLLAFGDSITNGGGELQWGVALQSWTQWLARSLGLPLTNYAVDGARASDVTAQQIPAHRGLNAIPDPRYQLGCLYIGVNDVRHPDWNPQHFERDYSEALAYLSGICDRTLTVKLPTDLGRPPTPHAVAANTIIERCGRAAGALLLDLSAFGGRQFLMVDHVHPTAIGQIEIAEQALSVLEAAGVSSKARPGSFARPHIKPSYRVRGALTYGYRFGKQAARNRLRSR